MVPKENAKNTVQLNMQQKKGGSSTNKSWQEGPPVGQHQEKAGTFLRSHVMRANGLEHQVTTGTNQR